VQAAPPLNQTLLASLVVIDFGLEGKPLKDGLPITLINYGRSPAFAGVLQMDFFCQTDLSPQFIPQKDHDVWGVRNILPPDGKATEFRWSADKIASELNAINNGTKKLYFLAAIAYRDGGGIWYSTGTAGVYDINRSPPGFIGVGDESHNFMT
jgi:hypothetical protein